jgi:lipopolysaccharide transport system permease protein
MQKPQTIIQPVSRWSLNLKELWQYRELFYFFTWRDIKVKYKQTYLGILWALIQPLSLMLLFTLIFSKNMRFDSGTMQYPIFVLSGLLLWNLFNSSVSMASESMLQHAEIIKKVFFPRLIIPISSLLAALFDFLIAFVAFILFCAVYAEWPHLTAFLFFPLAISLIIIGAAGTGLFLSALNIKFRDFRYVVPFALQFLFFATQVVYPLHSIKQEWLRYLLSAHPVNGAIELFRAAFTNYYDPAIIIISVASSLFIILIGGYYFKKTEAYFADLA